MKAIPSAKWLAMSAKKKSWIVARAKGEKAHVYWHCVAQDGTKHGGSMTRKSQCDSMISTARSLTQKEADRIPCQFPHPFADCVAKPCTAFAHYAEYEHVALGLIPDLVTRFGKVEIADTALGIAASAGGISVVGDSMQTSMCLLFLRLLNFISD